LKPIGFAACVKYWSWC